MNKGYWYAVGCYGLWGLLPVYWKLLHVVPALEIVTHRIIWSCGMMLALLLARRDLGGLWQAARRPGVLRVYLIAATLIGANWLIYIWAVNANYVVETSLGYFINPLVSVALGTLFLREKLRLWQWVPLGLATAGVLYLTVLYGSPPWIALALAGTFGVYGLVKKQAPLSSLYGLTVETGVLFLPALAYLGWLIVAGQAAFPRAGVTIDLLAVGAGLVTTVPLLLFASAARSIPLSHLGLFQYMAPTLQFLLGVLVYHEKFTPAQAVGFGLVWAALLIFAAEGLWEKRRQRTLDNRQQILDNRQQILDNRQ